MAARKKSGSQKYGEAATRSVERAMRKRREGTLKSGAGRHPKVTSREQAIAIGLSEAREAGAKVPRKRTTTKSGAKKSGTRQSTAKKSSRKRAVP